MKLRNVSLQQVIWLDPHTQNKDNEEYLKEFISAFKEKEIDFKTAENIDIAIDLVKDSVHTIIIASNNIAEVTVEKILNIDVFESVVVFTDNIEEKRDEGQLEWTTNNIKVRSIVNNWKNVVDSVCEGFAQINQN